MISKKVFLWVQWLALFTFCLLTILLILQNFSLKEIIQRSGSKQSPKCETLLFESNLEEKFLFKKSPIDISFSDLHFLDKKADYGSAKGFIIIIFDLTVCGKCLHQELEMLEEYKEWALSNDIFFLAIAGVADKSEESEIINLHHSGLLSFPCKIVDASLVYEGFLLNKEHFLDTPIFFYSTPGLKFLDIFKPAYLDTQGLKKWLEIILERNTT